MLPHTTAIQYNGQRQKIFKKIITNLLKTKFHLLYTSYLSETVFLYTVIVHIAIKHIITADKQFYAT